MRIFWSLLRLNRLLREIQEKGQAITSFSPLSIREAASKSASSK
jgi:hypothetical protein